MNEKKFWPVMLMGGILLLFVGALWVIRVLPSQAAQPMPPITDLLLQDSDLARCGFEWEQAEQDTKESAKETAEALGLPLDYLEGHGVYFVFWSSPESGTRYASAFGSTVQAFYRYESEMEAIAQYERLVEAFPQSSVGRETPIIGQYERSLKEVKGQIIETQNPIGIAYWFIGVRRNLLMVMGVLSLDTLSLETNGGPVFEELLSIALEQMAESQ